MIDTSVAIDLDRIDPRHLPIEYSLPAISLAELSAGPRATADPIESSRRQTHLQNVESLLEPIPFDGACARAYGRVIASVIAAGRKPRGRRAVDLLIAATALAHDLPLYTRNPDDFSGIDGLTVVAVP